MSGYYPPGMTARDWDYIAGDPLRCPACGGDLDEEKIDIVVCADCKATFNYSLGTLIEISKD